MENLNEYLQFIKIKSIQEPSPLKYVLPLNEICKAIVTEKIYHEWVVWFQIEVSQGYLIVIEQ